MSDFLPEFTASARFTADGSGALVFDAVPAAGIAAALAPFFRGDKGDKGDKGDVGPAFAQRRVVFLATSDGEQTIALGIAPTVGQPIHVFVNGILHITPEDYSTTGATLNLTEGVGVFSGDHISIIYQ